MRCPSNFIKSGIEYLELHMREVLDDESEVEEVINGITKALEYIGMALAL
jgi:hypothetical protein